MRRDLDHLPAPKRRELERIVAILFEEFETTLALASQLPKKRGRITKIVHYDSHARGGWVDEPHTAKGYQSDFDLLVIVNAKRLTVAWSMPGRATIALTAPASRCSKRPMSRHATRGTTASARKN